MKQIPPDKREVLAKLFANHAHIRMLIEAVLEGRFGTALADTERDPQVARLSLNVFHVFGGDPHHPLAQEMLLGLPPAFVLLDSDAWRESLFQQYGEQIQPLSRTAFSSVTLDIERLRSLIHSTPGGFQVRRIDLDMARRMAGELETKTLLHVFSSPEEFVEHGIGFASLHENQIVCVAASFVICNRGIEIQIETHPGFRRRGLATATAAALITHCLENGLEPEWDAENPPSVGLAEKLGYTRVGTYEAFIVLPG